MNKKVIAFLFILAPAVAMADETPPPPDKKLVTKNYVDSGLSTKANKAEVDKKIGDISKVLKKIRGE
jgi:hypothetical protein